MGLILGGLVLAVVTMLTLPIYGEHGGQNISLAISRYMDHNEGRWPSSWDDIEPYHQDPVLAIHSTAIVRQFWDVNWNVDPQQLHQESRTMPRPATSPEQGVLPVVYNRNWHSKDRPVTRWVLSPFLQRQLDKKEEEATASKISVPPPR